MHNHQVMFSQSRRLSSIDNNKPHNSDSKDKKESSEEEEISENISFLTLFRFATRCDKLMIAIALMSSFIAGLFLPYAITLVANAFNSMVTYDKSVKEGKGQSDLFLTTMHEFSIIYSSIGVVLFMGGYLGSALMNLSAIKQVFRLRIAYLKAALYQDFEYYDTNQTKDFASKMADDVIKLEEGIGDKLSTLVFNITIALGCIVMALYKGWKLALMCLTSAPISFLLVGLTSKLAQRLTKKETVESGRASAVAEEVFSSIRTVYAFNGQQKEIERYRKPLARVRNICIKKEFCTGLSLGLLFLCLFGSYALAFYCGIYLIIHDPHNYNADVMFAVFFGVMTGMANIGMVGSLMGAFGSARGAGAHIFKLLDKVPKINALLDQGIKLNALEGNVELRGVVFHYPSRPEVNVLNGLNLNVKRGQSVALVGHSGCGKSTIIQLISRYYDVIDGNVMVDGNDVREVSVRWLRAQVGLVGQEPVLFNTTVRENIRYGRDDATDEDIEACARQANAHQFIMKLPKGYDTMVGEAGASLSGGQKQRIAIARALVRAPRILLLDEATSALDASSEARVQQALDKAAVGRTTIIVAHRLATIRNVDVIHVLQNGRVVESGSHGDLMQLKGLYYDMLTLQDPDAAVEKEKEDKKEAEDFELVRDESFTSKASKTSKMSKGEYEDTLSERETTADQPPLPFCSVLKLNRPEWKAITVGSFSSIVLGCAMPLFVVFFGDLFGAMSGSDPNQLSQKVNRFCFSCIGLGLVMGCFNVLESAFFGIAGAYLTERLRLRMFEHLLRQPVAYFDERANSTGALCARLSLEAAYVQGATGQRMGVVLQCIGSVVLALVLALVYEWRVALVALSFCPVVGVVVYYQGKAITMESFGNAKTLEGSTKVAMEAVSNIRTVASLGREQLFLEEYEAQLRPALAPARRAAHLRAVVAALSRSMFNFMNSAALTYGGHLIVSDGVRYERVLVTTQGLQMAANTTQNAFTFVADFQKGASAASRIVALLNTKPSMTDPDRPAVSPFRATGDASFKDVEFSYPNRPGVKVLRGLDFLIPRGQTVALVGHSGCGKSTVVKLLQRYYDPLSGYVALDGIPLPRLRIAEVRETFGLVSQEPVLFNRTLRENIAYGDNAREPSQKEVEKAAMQANIHKFIISLPQGYDTNIGAKGVQLSGGQKQRVAIARALIRLPKILLLDEATSALDTENEKVVQEALDRAKAGRTCVTIAHRLSTVRDADTICVVHDGRVAESGTHTQLMELHGLYHRLHASRPSNA